MIPKISPIDSRVFAYARQPQSTIDRQTTLKKKHVGLAMKTTKTPIKLAHPPKKDGMKGEASAGKFHHKFSNIQLDIKFTTRNDNINYISCNTQFNTQHFYRTDFWQIYATGDAVADIAYTLKNWSRYQIYCLVCQAYRNDFWVIVQECPPWRRLELLHFPAKSRSSGFR